MSFDLNIIWFILVGVLFTGYAMLDGFDLGIGALHLFTKDDKERRVLLNSIGPVWDGNEVWLVTGGGALFAAFPNVYATVFSGFYLAFYLLLASLIFRALTLYRRHPHQMSRNWKAMEQEWHRFLKKMQNLAPARASQSLARGASNMQRYFAFLAYEAGEPQTAARILAASIRSSPVPFVTDLRNWKVVAATAAALVLPSAVHSALERLAGVKRASV